MPPCSASLGPHLNEGCGGNSRSYGPEANGLSFFSFFLNPLFLSQSQRSVFTLPRFPFCSSVNLLSLFRFINLVIMGSLPGKLVWTNA